jgi:hypothetical protein
MGALRQPGPEDEIDEFCIQQNSALVEEASAAVESLSDQTAQLTEALSLEQQLGILVLMLLTSKGAATVSQLAERHLYPERFPAWPRTMPRWRMASCCRKTAAMRCRIPQAPG